MFPFPMRAMLLLGAIFLVGIIAVSARSRQSAADAEQPPVVYICRDSKAVFYSAFPLTDTVHPETGRPTLTSAVYCPQCAAWQPAPPAERRYGNSKGLLCPKCKTPRSFTGDLPEYASEL